MKLSVHLCSIEAELSKDEKVGSRDERALFKSEQCSFLGVELLNHLFSLMYSVVYL
jgi:hypothetical protein